MVDDVKWALNLVTFAKEFHCYVLLFYIFKIWGDDVETFRPGRWFDENGDIRNVPQFIPFGIVMFHFLKSVGRIRKKNNYSFGRWKMKIKDMTF